jgi:hypothetical protein
MRPLRYGDIRCCQTSCTNKLIIIMFPSILFMGPTPEFDVIILPLFFSLARCSRIGSHILLIEFELRRINVFSVATGDGISCVCSTDIRLGDLECVSSTLGKWDILVVNG